MIDPILITGCSRSGTTMTAGILYLCGAFGGNINGPSKRDDGGMFGNVEIRNKIIGNELGPFLPFEEFKDLITSGMVRQGYVNGKWFYKDTELLLPWMGIDWGRAFPKAQYVIVRRKTEDIVSSCMKTGYMKQCTTKKEWEAWVEKRLICFGIVKNVGFNILEVWPTKFIEGDFSEIRETVEKLGLKWEEDKIMNFMNPELRGSQL